MLMAIRFLTEEHKFYFQWSICSSSTAAYNYL